MKFYIFALLLAVCIYENDAQRNNWRQNIKINYWQQINDVVNRALGQIQNDVNAKGNTPAAQACYESARSSLRNISSTGYNQVSSCTSTASTAGDASVCSQQVVSDVFNQSMDKSREASDCISKS